MSPANGSFAGLSSDELRAAVRAVLLDVLPASVTQNGSPRGPVTAAEVTLRTDADLDAFVRRVAALCDDPAERAALRDGHRRFRLTAPDASHPAASPAAAGPVQRIDQGAVTERAVKKAKADGARLVLGRRAVMTPLARDKARILGVEIEKER